MEIFTGHYGVQDARERRTSRLLKRANPVDGLFDPLDRNDL